MWNQVDPLHESNLILKWAFKNVIFKRLPDFESNIRLLISDYASPKAEAELQ